MSDFTARAEAEAARRALAESASPWADASLIGAGMDQFLDGVRWAERELLADPTADEIGEVADMAELSESNAETAIHAFLEVRRGSE